MYQYMSYQQNITFKIIRKTKRNDTHNNHTGFIGNEFCYES